MHVIKHRDIYCPTPINLTVGLAGFFKYEAVNVYTGKRRLLVDWHRNKVLDSGRNVMATQDPWMGACQVGTDSTPPLATDTGLLGYLAGTTTIQEETSGAEASAPYYGWKRRTYRFAPGTFAGENLSEAGVGWQTTGSNLVSRALIIDPSTQLPTTITPLADEYLDVTYEMRYYPPLGDTNQQVDLNGVTYDTISRASEVASGSYWASDIGEGVGQRSNFTLDWQAYDGNIGTILQAPSGLSAPCDNANQFNLGYVNNSYTIGMQCNTGGTGWNLGSGIRSIRISTTAGNYQTQFDAESGGATIPKDDNYTMIMVWNLNWIEATIP